MIEYTIGRELTILSHAIEHLEIVTKWYDRYDSETADEPTQSEDVSLRYYSDQHLTPYMNWDKDNYEVAKLGYRIIKRDVVLDTLKNKKSFVETAKQKCKEKILEIVSNAKAGPVYTDKAKHNFYTDILWSRTQFDRTTVFEVVVNLQTQSVIIKDAYEEKYKQGEYEMELYKARERYQQLAGVEL